MPSKTITAAEAARILSVTEHYIVKLCYPGKYKTMLRPVVRRPRILFDLEDIRAFARTRRRPGHPSSASSPIVIHRGQPEIERYLDRMTLSYAEATART